MWPEENNKYIDEEQVKLAGYIQKYLGSGMAVTQLNETDRDVLDSISRHIFSKIPNPEADMKLGSDQYIVREVDCPEEFRDSVIGREWLKGNTFLVGGNGGGIYRVPRGTSRELLHKVPLTSLHSEKNTREACWLKDQAKRAGLDINTRYVFITVRVEQPRPQVQRLPFEDIPL